MCRSETCKITTKKACKKCNLVANNLKCYKVHQESVCSSLNKCETCGVTGIYTNHICGFDKKWCVNCKQSVELEHKCFILSEAQRQAQYKKEKKEQPFSGYVFFDFETWVEPSTQKHEVNLAMAQLICNKCVDIENEENRCDKCNENMFSIQLNNIVSGHLSSIIQFK